LAGEYAQIFIPEDLKNLTERSLEWDLENLELAAARVYLLFPTSEPAS
jgi:hypothetical protein